MARIRTIKPDFWSDEKIVELTPWARLLFIGLWNFSDDEGRMPFSPKKIKMLVFPGDDVDVPSCLDELSREELIRVYEREGGHYLAIRNFAKHQKIDKRAPSRIPDPPDHSPPEMTGYPADSPQLPPNSADLLQIPPSSAESRRVPPPEGNGREEEKEGKGGGKERAATVSNDDPDFVKEGLDPYQYATAFLEEFRLPTNRGMLELVGSAIGSLAKGDGVAPEKAFRTIRDRARVTKARGDPINRFWFEDGGYLDNGERRSDGKSGFAEELRRRLHCADAGDVAD